MSQWSDLVSGLIQAYRTLKGLQIYFLTANRKKRSEEYLVINVAVERKLWAIFLLRGVHLWKKQTPGGRLKVKQNKLKLKL